MLSEMGVKKVKPYGPSISRVAKKICLWEHEGQVWKGKEIDLEQK